jgi:hypothetical protein
MEKRALTKSLAMVDSTNLHAESSDETVKTR